LNFLPEPRYSFCDFALSYQSETLEPAFVERPRQRNAPVDLFGEKMCIAPLRNTARRRGALLQRILVARLAAALALGAFDLHTPIISGAEITGISIDP
jgi:hypothetical protein